MNIKDVPPETFYFSGGFVSGIIVGIFFGATGLPNTILAAIGWGFAALVILGLKGLLPMRFAAAAIIVYGGWRVMTDFPILVGP